MNEQQLARYLRAVRRRLALPREKKDRVIDDLRSAIAERREAGQSDAEILSALGSSRQAAEELNAQLRADTYRKSPWRFACLGAAVLALLTLVVQVSWQLSMPSSVGVIGGADGPTAIFVSSTNPLEHDWTGVVLAGLVLLLGVIGYFLLRRIPPKKS